MATPLEQWVSDAAQMTRPAKITWCDGSEEEYHRLVEGMLEDGTLMPLNQKTYPD